MEQAELASIFALRPQNFGWFLGAGASRSAGMPTATDILWDLKRKYYCHHEVQDVSSQDLQSSAIRERIQAYMESKGFPEQWADQEYPRYFELIFGEDRERQRKYIRDALSDDKVRLTVGNRVFGALLAGGFSRIAFTTNFDTIVEKAVAEVGSTDLNVFHLEGPTAANNALNNEEYPLYCKIHGDFRYESIRNLPADLVEQNTALGTCFLNASQRFGVIVAGFSGRDDSVMRLFNAVLELPNPFPHGLFWTELKSHEISSCSRAHR